MGLRLKFNLVILATFLVGFCATALLLNWRFDHDAREEALASARIMIEAADAIRNYTSKEVTPVVGHELEGKFVRASVPAFAARAHFAALKSEFPARKPRLIRPTSKIGPPTGKLTSSVPSVSRTRPERSFPRAIRRQDRSSTSRGLSPCRRSPVSLVTASQARLRRA